MGAGLVFLLGVSVPLAGPLVIDAFEAALRVFGLALALLVLAAAAGARLALRARGLGWPFWRRWAGLHFLLLFVFGLLGLWKPGWSVGDADLRASTAGGELGRALSGNPVGWLIWAAIGLGALGLVWPAGYRLAWRGSARTLRFIASLRIPQRVWSTVQSFFTSLVPRERESASEIELPYISQWDEDWAAIEAEERQAPQPVPPDDSGEQLELTLSQEAASSDRELEGRPAGNGWQLPPMGMLAEAEDIEVRPLDNEVRSQLIVDTLDSFGVDARVVTINQGPTVTQFGVEPGWEVKTRSVQVRDERGRPIYDREGKPVARTEVVSKTRVRVNKITSLANDLALALAAPTIRIEAPVPGKPVIGIEVPNTTMSLVSLRSVIEGTSFQRILVRSKLAIGLGKGVSGEPVAADLAKMPHLLIAGATGSGKSVCINSIIACLLMHNTPEDLRLVLIDPKRVEMTTFKDVPHLVFSKIITDAEEVVGTLQAVIQEMDSRYRRFASLGVRNLETYNKSPRAPYKLPYWVVIIDELADLMMAAPYQVERQICRLAQLARATGIHVIIATQRPSVDVVTGLIKANFPTRIAFAVSSQVDSRTIIDGSGAEKLLGRGDMLFMATDAAKPRRLQGSYLSDQELDEIVSWWASDSFRHLRPEPMDHLLEQAKDEGEAEAEEEEDPLYQAAKDLASQHSRVSTSLLQRRLHIGYPRAARLIDLLEEEGIVGPAESGQSREVLGSGVEESNE